MWDEMHSSYCNMLVGRADIANGAAVGRFLARRVEFGNGLVMK